MKNRVAYSFENITPEKAREYLSRSNGNRPISRLTVAKYAKMMRKGEWELSSDAITFDNEGVLINGHHRLTAVIESGATVPMGVLCGVPHRCIQAIDIGKSRTLNDVVSFALPGYQDIKDIVSVVRYLLGYRTEREKNTAIVNVTKRVMTQNDIIDFVREHYDELQDALEMTSGISYCQRIFRVTAYLLRHVQREKVQYFFDRCGDGVGLEKGSPILLLRDKLIKMGMHGGQSYTEAQYYINTAWNLYVKGEKRKFLRKEEGTGVPELLFGEKMRVDK